jgi:hypothetical protein
MRCHQDRRHNTHQYCTVQASGILSHMPRWPALSDTVGDSHLNLIKDRNSPDDLEAKARKQRNASHVGRDTRALQEVGGKGAH